MSDNPIIRELGDRPMRLHGLPITKAFEVSTHITRWYIGDVLIGTLTARQLMMQDDAHPRLVLQGSTSKFHKSRNDFAVFDAPCIAEVDIDWPAILADIRNAPVPEVVATCERL